MRGKGLPGYLPAGTWPGDPSPGQGHAHAAGVWFLGASGCWRQKSQLCGSFVFPLACSSVLSPRPVPHREHETCQKGQSAQNAK